jgi:hypothetical protein
MIFKQLGRVYPAPVMLSALFHEAGALLLDRPVLVFDENAVTV